MKRLLISTLIGAYISLFSSVSFAKGEIKIAVLMYGMKAEFVQLMGKAAYDHPLVKSGEVKITMYDGRYDALVQNDQAELAIRTNHDAIIINPMDFNANVDVVDMANKANIPVIVTNARLNTDKMTSEVVSDDVRGGYLEAKFIMDKIGCKGNIVVFEGPKGGSGEIQRGQGNEKAINECPKGAVKILERKTANWSRSESMNLMENWLTKHQGKIDGIIGQNDEMALGAIEAIEGSGASVANFAIAGIDGVTDALLAVKNDKMVSILQDAVAQMQGSIDVALLHIIGEKYTPKSKIWEQYKGELDWNNGLSKRYDIPWTIVNKENVDELLDTRK